MSFLGLPVLGRTDIVSLVLQGCILECYNQDVACAIRKQGGIHFPKSIQVLADWCQWFAHVDRCCPGAKFVPREVLKCISICSAQQRHILLLGWLGSRLHSNFWTL